MSINSLEKVNHFLFISKTHIFRLWLIKNNISSNIPVLELINTPKHDQHILSALCSAASYTLPSQSEQQPMDEQQPMVTEDALAPVAEPETMFFIDRGVPEPAVEETTEETAEKSVYVSALEDQEDEMAGETVEEMVEEIIVSKDILNVTLEPIVPEVAEIIKIKNEKTPKKHKACKNVMVIDGTPPTPRQTRSKRSKKEKTPTAEKTEETAPEAMEVEGASIKKSTPEKAVVKVESAEKGVAFEDVTEQAEPEATVAEVSEVSKPVVLEPEAVEPDNKFEALDILAESAVVEAERIRAVSTEEVVTEEKAKTSDEISAETVAILDKALASDIEEMLDSTITDPAPTLLSLTPHNISLLNETEIVAADDNASMTSSIRRSTRKRNSSAGSEVSNAIFQEVDPMHGEFFRTNRNS